MDHSDTAAATSQQEGHHRVTDNPSARRIDHPDWCDLARCTATPAMGTGEAHRETPRTVTIWGIHGELEVTAYLSQANCRWPTDVYVDLDVHGLRHEYQLAHGTAAFPVDKLAALVEMLTDLATTGHTSADRQLHDEPAAIHRRSATERSTSTRPRLRRGGQEVDR
jgi:hypothetical protein